MLSALVFATFVVVLFPGILARRDVSIQFTPDNQDHRDNEDLRVVGERASNRSVVAHNLIMVNNNDLQNVSRGSNWAFGLKPTTETIDHEKADGSLTESVIESNDEDWSKLSKKQQQTQQKAAAAKKKQQQKEYEFEGIVIFYASVVFGTCSLVVVLLLCWPVCCCHRVPVISNARQLEAMQGKQVWLVGRVNAWTFFGKAGQVMPEITSPIAQASCCYYKLEIVKLSPVTNCWRMPCEFMPGVFGKRFGEGRDEVVYEQESRNSKHLAIEVDADLQFLKCRVSAKRETKIELNVPWTSIRTVQQIASDPRLAKLIQESCPELPLDNILLREIYFKPGELMKAGGRLESSNGAWTMTPMNLKRAA